MSYLYHPLHKPVFQPILGKYVLGAQAGPQTVIIQQVVGEREGWTNLDIAFHIPYQKPAIEQILDVFIKNLRMTRVEAIFNKVIVCGDFEIMAIYVACLPEQPVHAAELRKVRFTIDIPMPGVLYGMDAEARLAVGFVDYDCEYGRIPGQASVRDFRVSVGLQAVAKVMTDREIVIYPGGFGQLPKIPKG